MSKLEKIADQRERILQDYPQLKTELNEMRERAIKQLPGQMEKVTKSLEGKGCRVYEAKTAEEAHEVLNRILKNEKTVVRTCSNTLKEITFDEVMEANEIEVHQSNVSELILNELGEQTEGHPIFPYLGLTKDRAMAGLQQYIKSKQVEGKELNRLTHQKIKKQIVASDFGVTGISSIAADNGTVILAEEEGDGRAVSNLPYNHIVVAGLEKITNTVEEATTTIQGTAIYGHGKKVPTYISYISGPSRTADIEFRMAYGMHGPKEVHVILLDNGRNELIEQGHQDVLKCIDCGACFTSMKQAADKNGWHNVTLTPKSIALGLVQGRLSKPSNELKIPSFECPVGIKADSLQETFKKIYPIKKED